MQLSQGRGKTLRREGSGRAVMLGGADGGKDVPRRSAAARLNANDANSTWSVYGWLHEQLARGVLQQLAGGECIKYKHPQLK